MVMGAQIREERNKVVIIYVKDMRCSATLGRCKN